MFAARSGTTGLLTRMLFRRGEVVNGNKTLNVDMNAPGSFVPAAQSLTVRGLLAGEELEGAISYSVQGGPIGTRLTPGLPQSKPDNTVAYSTVVSAPAAGDRYRGWFTTSVNYEVQSRIEVDFKTPVALDLAFPPRLSGSEVTVAAKAPQVRLRVKAPLAQNTAGVAVKAKAGGRVWDLSFEVPFVAAGSPLDETTPDLSSLDGWQSIWGLPVGVVTTASVTIFEAKAPLSDGTSVRSTSGHATITP